MTDRVYFDDSLGKYADEHLEVVFKQVYEWDVGGEQSEAIGCLLDEYTIAIYGKDAVLGDALVNLDSAIKWCIRFGELRVISVDDGPCFIAKVGPDRKDQKKVRGTTFHQTVLLAGIQVLRETAYDFLNNRSNDTTH